MQNWKPPRDNEKYRWTHHVVRKMQYYALSPSRVLRVVNAPARVEEGVAPGTLAGMQIAGTKAKPWEIWAMWRDEKKGTGNRGKGIGGKSGPLNPISYTLNPSPKVIITAWRYPGTSPVRSAVPIPAGVLAELESEGLLDASTEEVV